MIEEILQTKNDKLTSEMHNIESPNDRLTFKVNFMKTGYDIPLDRASLLVKEKLSTYKYFLQMIGHI